MSCVRILVAGDFCPNIKIEPDTFQEIKHLFQESDMRIVNLECALEKGGGQPIIKEGPSISCSLEQFEQLEFLPIDILTLANNHTLDYGEKGLLNILGAARGKYDTVGAGTNLCEAQTILYKTVNRHTIAIINCCESEFSIASETKAGSNPVNPIHIYYQIQEAKKNADAVIVIVHGGHEYYQLPSPRMQKMYRFFIDVGACFVIGHHPHCFSGMEKYNDGYIFYSLGNFLFHNNSDQHTVWNDGYLVQLNLDFKESLSVNYRIIPYTQCLGNKRIKIKKANDLRVFNETFDLLSNIIITKDHLQSRFNDYVQSQQRKSLSRMLPYSGHYLVALFKRGLFPSFLTKKMLVSRLNAIQCEAHRDIIVETLKTKLHNG